MKSSSQPPCDNAEELLHAAFTWAKTTGWPTRRQDLMLAAKVWVQLDESNVPLEERGTALLGRLIESFTRTGSDPEWRALLARLVVHAAEGREDA